MERGNNMSNGTWVYRNMGVQEHECKGTWVYRNMGVQEHGC